MIAKKVSPEESNSLRKSKRLRSEHEEELAKYVLSSYGGTGVAASLYYYVLRTTYYFYYPFYMEPFIDNSSVVVVSNDAAVDIEATISAM